MMLDTRAATYTKLGQTKEALKDAKKTIEVAPERWQGYARAAQLFLDLKKIDASVTMVKMALKKMTEKETNRRAFLLSLEAKALKAQADADRHRRRFSDHLGNLPVELFGEIARLVIKSNHAAVITLSQVSKHWRSVTHNSPYLWDVLMVNNRRPKQKAKLWIERSQGKLRELTIRASVMDTSDWPDNSLKGLRWEEIRVLKFDTWDLGKHLLSIQDSGTALDLLEHLDITNANWETILPHDNCLHHLALRCTNITSHCFTKISSNSQKLKALTLENVKFTSGTTLLELLQSLPFIKTLVLHDSNSPVPKDLALPHLTCLDIKRSTASSLSLSDLPELRILRLEGVQTARQLLDVVSKTSSHITELVLRSCAVPPTLVIGVLKNSPELERLELSNSEARVVAEFLATLRQPLDSSSITSSQSLVQCPNLQYINFSRCGDIQTGPIVRMIKARLPPAISEKDNDALAEIQSSTPHQRITTLVIDECMDVDSAWLPWIRTHVPNVSCVYMKKKTKFRI